MPRTRSLAWAELKIGLVSIFALAMAMLLIFLLGGDTGFFWQRYSVKTMFPNIAGLKEGAPVRLAGAEVGSVTDLDFIGDRVEVVMEIGRDNMSRITTASVASLGAVSLLGESAVDITASSKGTPIPEWGYIRAGKAAGSLADVTTQATEGIEELTGLLKDVRGGRGTAGKLFTDEQLYNELNDFIMAAEAVANGINQGRGTFGRLSTDPTAARSLEASLKNLEAVTGRIRSGEGSLGQLLHDDSLSRSLTSTSNNLDAITARLNRGEGTAGKLMTDEELYNRLNSMADRLDKVAGSLQNGEGTVGQLMQDKQLYEKLNRTVDEVQGLVAAIKADPKRYLTVRVSLF